jgi:hypothetical protein
MALPGFRRLPGRLRNYETPQGAVISKRQYDRIARELLMGFKGSSERYAVERAREGYFNPKSMYGRAIRNYRAVALNDDGTQRFSDTAKASAITSDPEFAELWQTWKRLRHRRGLGPAGKDNARTKVITALGFYREVGKGEWIYIPAF